ncbi:Uncharacterised protein [Acinetobacter baumannii]|nr:Uncharacterised protein [Acinetobacter baumannii]
MSLRNTVKFTHVTLRLVPKILYAIDVILPVFFVDKLGAVIDPVMLKNRSHPVRHNWQNYLCRRCCQGKFLTQLLAVMSAI